MAEPRLRRRYHQLVVSHLSAADQLAAGLRPPPSLNSHFAAVQAAWRFYNNPRVDLPQLVQPLVDCARKELNKACSHYLLVALDWCSLHFKEHDSRSDRIRLTNRADLGYDLLTALAVGDKDGSPVAPLCVELRAADGVHSTRSAKPLKAGSRLDAVAPVMEHVVGMDLDKPCVFVIDREGDSVAHYRDWSAKKLPFLVRANDARRVRYQGAEFRLNEVADSLEPVKVNEVRVKEKPAWQYAAETVVTLHRPARTHRVGKDGVKRHRNVADEELSLRLVVSEIRDQQGKRVSRWLLLTNLEEDVDAATLATWYYWRWRIESYHKLLKSAGQQVESWRQETAVSLSRRLLVAAMSAAMVWRLARDESPEAEHMRGELVRLSGRQMKRGKGRKDFTEPALMAGLGMAVKMLEYLRTSDLGELVRLMQAVLPGLIPKMDLGPDP